MLKRSSRSRDLAVERLRWTLLAALSGVSVGMAACSGRSERHDESTAEAGDGGSSGSSVSSGRGGSVSSAGTFSKSVGGTGNVPGTGGAASGASGSAGSSDGGTFTTGGTGEAGEGAAAGTGGASAGTGNGGTDSGGAGGAPPLGCAAASSRGELEECEGPFVHRPTAAACDLPERRGPGEGGAGGIAGAGGTGGTGGTDLPPTEHQCDTDLDCDALPNGFCTVETGGNVGPYRSCTYACSEDADCDAGHICACADDYTHAGEEETIQLGTCRPATCTTDFECGEGSLCISPVDGICSPLRPSAFHCQSSDDECASTADCLAYGVCMHDGARFVCMGRPTCGRPFLVFGSARLAPAAAAGDWLETAPEPAAKSELADELSAEIARHYLEAGLMEHASIAAFARFALQLLALGAPAELLEDTTRAMQDETRHAKLCFGVAARYSTSPAGPGPLELTGALSEGVDLLSVADLVITEGCIGETGAALEVAWAAAATEDPELRALLYGIADDELRHAALAFRFVAWAGERDPRVKEQLTRRVSEARRAVAAEIATLSSARTAPSSGAADRAEALARHGVLDELTRAEARRRALEEIVDGAVLALNETPRARHFTSSISVVSQPNSSST